MEKAKESQPAKKQPANETGYVMSRLLMDADIVERQIAFLTDFVVERAVPIVAGKVKALGTPNRLLPIPEAAEMLGRTKGAVRNMLDRGQLRWVRPPGSRKRYIELLEVERYIKRGRGGAE